MVGSPPDSTLHIMSLNYITYSYIFENHSRGRQTKLLHYTLLLKYLWTLCWAFPNSQNHEQSHILHTGPLSTECKHFWHLCFPATLPILSPPPRCLFIRQTICRKLCVFPWRRAPSARWRSSPNYLAHAGSPAWAAAQRAEMKPACVFAPGSLSARLRVMGESGGEFSPSASPHYSSLQAD